MSWITPDWVTPILTFALVAATGVLAWQTARLVYATRSVGKESVRLQVMPSLSLEAVQPLKASGGKSERFSVINHGKGIAKITKEYAQMKDGRSLDIQRHSTGHIMDVHAPFYWDIHGVKEGDEVIVTIGFTDMVGTPYPDFTATFTIR